VVDHTCQICGRENAADAQFCRGCGASLSASTASGIGTASPELPRVSFPQSIRLGFKNYFRFSGRSTRAEFWWFFLVSAPVVVILPTLSPFFLIANLALVIPFTSLATRRLHDIGKSGWWLLLLYAPYLFLFALNRLIDAGGLTLLSGPNPDNASTLMLLKIQLGLLRIGAAATSVGFLLGIISLSWKGNTGPNRHGPDPRQATSDRFDAEIDDRYRESVPESQHCTNCKVSLVVGVSFCTSCGASVRTGERLRVEIGLYEREINEIEREINEILYQAGELGSVHDFRRKTSRKWRFPLIATLVFLLLLGFFAWPVAGQTGWFDDLGIFSSFAADRAYNTGSAHLEQGRHREAIEEFNEAVRRDPRKAEAYYSRAFAYAELGQYEQAIQDLDEAIRLNPNDTDSYQLRGQTYQILGLFKEAERDLARARAKGNLFPFAPSGWETPLVVSRDVCSVENNDLSQNEDTFIDWASDYTGRFQSTHIFYTDLLFDGVVVARISQIDQNDDWRSLEKLQYTAYYTGINGV
jgi:uncharacterized membrane protein YhaH (DUF805 family)